MKCRVDYSLKFYLFKKIKLMVPTLGEGVSGKRQITKVYLITNKQNQGHSG